MDNSPASQEDIAQYRAAQAAVAMAEFPDWGVLRFAGPERAKFLQGLMTSDVLALVPGKSGWSCLLTAKGRIRAHVLLISREEEVWALGPAAALDNMVADFSRVIVLSQTTMSRAEDLSAPVLLLGPQARATAARAAESGAATASDERFAPPGFWIFSPKGEADKILSGAARLGPAAFEMLRLESGVPAFGRELGEETFPQEALLDACVSLTKGCYLGQEIMSRLSRRGHVNRLLVRLKISGVKVPAAGTQVSAQGRETGAVASAAWSPRADAALALAFVRREDAAAGAKLDLPGGISAEVV